MTGPIRNTRAERGYDSYVESPTRANKTAVEVYVGNPGDISGGGGTTSVNLKTDYQSVSAVVNSITTTVLSHTFSSSLASKIYSVSASGENISLYELLIDSVLVEKKRTYFGESLNVSFDFPTGYSVGLSSLVELKVYHTRPTTADFNATLKYSEAL